MNSYGAQDMVSPLARVIVRAPIPTMAEAEPGRWHYGGGLTQAALNAQHAGLVAALEESGAEIIRMDHTGDDLCDAVFTHDPSLVSRAGAILLRMGKALRVAETEAHARLYATLGVPVLGRITAPGTVEGGDCLWVGEDTLLVGRGFRTNQSGIDQLRALLAPLGVSVRAFDLPVCSGAAACLHLMSIISMLDHDLALVRTPLLPVALFQDLRERGIALIEADGNEFQQSGGLSLNVLATGPRRCIAIAGFPQTKAALEQAGCTVATFNGEDLCNKCEGGPTCLTRPLLRESRQYSVQG